MRKIGVVTVARSDYGIYLPVIQKIKADPDLDLRLIVTGAHLVAESGLTVRAIEGDGFEVHERVEMMLASDSPEGIAKSMGLGTIGLAQAYARQKPDILLVLGDRFEMHAAVVAAVPFKIPIAHLHGGELTEGAIDEVFRHSITKMSHLHFVATETYAKRVIQMGEEPGRVVVSGAPSLDNLNKITPLDPTHLKDLFGFDLSRPSLLVTFHPETLASTPPEEQIQELLAALEESGLDIIVTYPNADPGGRAIIEMIEAFAGRHERVWIAANLGTEAYFSVMSHAAAMVGNSSSGIIEAASFKLPVVNIGRRQQGRIRERNVIDVQGDREGILAGINKAVSPDFKAGLSNLSNPYGDGQAASRITDKLKSVKLDEHLLVKRFQDHE